MEHIALQKAVTLVGSHRLAKAVGVKTPSVFTWLKTGRAPAERCIAIEIATDGQVTRYQLRPDVFGEAPPSNPSQQVA